MQSIVSRRRMLKHSVTIAALVLCVTGPAWGQQGAAKGYPSKPIRLVIGFAAGGGQDLLARIVAPKLAESLGQPVVIENKPGAGGRLGVEYVQNQSPDGYTLAVAATGQMSIAAAIYPKLSYHPTHTFTPLTMIASYPLIIASRMNNAIESVNDLITWSKAHPDQSHYAASSPAFTIPIELIKLKTGMTAQAIPYKSTNEMLLSVAGGQTLFTIADPSSAISLVQAGKIRALAVTGAARISELADVPTMHEVGLGDIEIRLMWSGVFAAAGTPPAIARLLETELRRVLADAGVRGRIKALSYDPSGEPGSEFARRIDADIQAYSDVVKAANLKFE